MSDSARRLQPLRKGNGALLGPTRALKCKWTARFSSHTLVSVFMHERRIGIGRAGVRLAARLTYDWAKLSVLFGAAQDLRRSLVECSPYEIVLSHF